MTGTDRRWMLSWPEGHNIKQMRKMRGLTQAELAHRMSELMQQPISRSSLAQRESGERQIGESAVAAAASVLGVIEDELRADPRLCGSIVDRCGGSPRPEVADADPGSPGESGESGAGRVVLDTGAVIDWSRGDPDWVVKELGGTWYTRSGLGGDFRRPGHSTLEDAITAIMAIERKRRAND